MNAMYRRWRYCGCDGHASITGLTENGRRRHGRRDSDGKLQRRGRAAHLQRGHCCGHVRPLLLQLLLLQLLQPLPERPRE